jgi:hypothetical protein
MQPNATTAPGRLAAALDRLTTVITSGSALNDSIVQPQLKQLQPAIDALPSHCSSFRADGEQAALLAAMAALQALADERHARTQEWVLLVAAAADAWGAVFSACSPAPRTEWVHQHSECQQPWFTPIRCARTAACVRLLPAARAPEQRPRLLAGMR